MNRGPAFALALAALLAVALAGPAPDDKYTDKWDNIDLDEILANDRLRNKYVECLLADNDSHCTPDGKELRKNIPDALTNECGKCTDKQKSGVEKVLKFLKEEKKDDFEKLLAKWDPEGVYRKKYEAKYSS
ncbi:hypothetical protein R5R35_005510 [Gryllus longicercus]|uniref:Chemosensory protein n=1 Tax=Gryllus longicercus TaxID=2509291 RepID=A0AAN9VLV5_9ORTH